MLRTGKRVVPVSYERLMANPLEKLGELLTHLDLDGRPVPPVEAIWAYMLERRDRYRSEQTLPLPEGPAARWATTLAPDAQRE